MEERVTLLWGARCDLDEAASVVENALGLKLTAADSWYTGGDYWRGESDHGETVVVQNNAETDEPLEPDVAEAVVVRVEGTIRPDLLQSALGDERLRLVRVEPSV